MAQIRMIMTVFDPLQLSHPFSIDCPGPTISGGSRGGQFGATSPQTSVAPPWMAPLCHKCAPFWCPRK